MAVVNPLKVTIENYPEDKLDDELDAVNNPEDPNAGTRKGEILESDLHDVKTLWKNLRRNSSV